MEYRREIDGLRALAVLPVILFHAGFEMFSGGFVGVDVFFVISGYLITTIILAELEQGKFSIVNFYERRARRILPALFLVMLVCIPFAWFWILTSDMKYFSQSLVAVSVFASNILFWRESGYFDTAAELKPLLHTWSLAVEEQYYVLFPLFLMLFWKLGKRWILVTLGLVFVASLAVAQWGAYAQPTAAFFLLPTRGWELLIGAFAAFYLSQANRKEFGKGLSEFGGWLGVALILYAVFAYSKATPFPGLYALVPTIGTVLIILFATQRTTVGKFVGNKAFVAVGLVSYSAYLWHQPLFAFARHRSLSEPSYLVFLLLSISSLLLAFISWKYVEAPFRKKGVVSRKTVFSFAVFGTLFFGSLGILGHLYSEYIMDYKYRNNPNLARSYKVYRVAQDTSPVFIDSNRFDNSDCRFSVLNLDSSISKRLEQCYEKYGSGKLVFGDSHATNLYHALVKNRENSKHKFLVGITKNGCHLPTEKADCQYSEILDFLKHHPNLFSHLIYEKAGNLMTKFTPDRMALRNESASVETLIDEEVVSGVARYLDAISQYSKVIWFGPRIEPLVTEREFMRFGCQSSFTPTARHKSVYGNLDFYLNDYSSKRSWRYVSQIDLIRFNFPDDFGDCSRLLWMDASHFSAAGEEVFGARFVIEDLLN